MAAIIYVPNLNTIVHRIHTSLPLAEKYELEAGPTKSLPNPSTTLGGTDNDFEPITPAERDFPLRACLFLDIPMYLVVAMLICTGKLIASSDFFVSDGK